MTEGTPWKHIVRFAMPVLAGSLLQQLYNTVDAIVVGKFAGEAALSAVGTTGSFAFLFLALALGFSAGNGVVVAQQFGAGNEKEVRVNASTGILFLMMLGAAAAVIGIVLARPAYTLLVNVPESFLDLTLQYFRIYAVGLIFQYGYNIFSSILRAVGDSAATLYFLLISSVLNIVLDLAFVAGFHWGVAGAAAATDIAQAASFAAAYLYMTRKYPIFRFGLREYTWSGRCVRQTVRVGFPIALQLIIVSMGLTLIQRVVNAFQTTLATYTGQNIGAGRMDRVKTGVRQTLLISLGMTLAISAMVWIFSGKIIGLFGLGSQAAEYCTAHIRTVAFINVILSLYVPLFGVFQGANHSGFPTIVATCALSMRVFVTYLFRYSSLFGHTIIWWNGLFGFSMGCTVAWIYYLSGRWQRNARL